MALAYLAAWKGPVLAADDPYGDGITDTSLAAVRHLQEARLIEEKDLNKIKSMIMRYGGVESSLYMSIQNAWDSSEDYEPMSASYYYSGNEEPNHDIVIIGWDDDYSRENFNYMPENNGAFLCRNSWGEDFGNDGYFYVSYEDSNLGNNNIVYTRLDETDNYRTIYQSDMLVGSELSVIKSRRHGLPMSIRPGRMKFCVRSVFMRQVNIRPMIYMPYRSITARRRWSSRCILAAVTAKTAVITR